MIMIIQTRQSVFKEIRMTYIFTILFILHSISVRDNWEKITDFTDPHYPVSTGGEY